MIVVTGGIASGRKTFLERQGITFVHAWDARTLQEVSSDNEELDQRQQKAMVKAMEALTCADIVLHAEELVRFGDVFDAVFEVLCGMRAVTCTEVGSGVIPLTWDDRQFRERAGGLSAALAKHAHVVVRMVCGIPLVLKGEMPSAQEETPVDASLHFLQEHVSMPVELAKVYE